MPMTSRTHHGESKNLCHLTFNFITVKRYSVLYISAIQMNKLLLLLLLLLLSLLLSWNNYLAIISLLLPLSVFAKLTRAEITPSCHKTWQSKITEWILRVTIFLSEHEKKQAQLQDFSSVLETRLWKHLETAPARTRTPLNPAIWLAQRKASFFRCWPWARVEWKVRWIATYKLVNFSLKSLCFINIRTFIQFKQRRLRNKQLSKNISFEIGQSVLGIFF